MTRADLVLKKLAQIETFVAELRALGHLARLSEDLVQRRFVEHTLQVAIQAVLDVASHIVSDDRLGEPRNNGELMELLARHGWIEPELGETLRRAAGFRNLVVHGYADVDLAVLREVAEIGVDDLLEFVKQIRRRLDD